MLTHLDLFSGIGGFALAARWAGIQTVQFVEKEEYCQRVLAKNFPEVPIHGYIETFRARQFRGSIDIISGGFPCQPFSDAGHRRGTEDDRYKWPQMRRVINAARPAWVVGENVTGIDGLALDRVLFDLETLGYEVWPLEIPAGAVGSPQQRKRIWILAHHDNRSFQPQHQIHPGRNAFGSRGEKLPAAAMANADGERKQQSERCLGEIGGRPGYSSQGMAHAESITQRKSTNEPEPFSEEGDSWAELGKRGEVLANPEKGRGQKRVQCSIGTESQYAELSGDSRISHWPAWQGQVPHPWEPARVCMSEDLFDLGCRLWANYSARLRAADETAYIRDVESALGRIADGLSGRVDRIRGLGNAIVPQVAYLIFKAIVDVKNNVRGSQVPLTRIAKQKRNRTPDPSSEQLALPFDGEN